MISDKIWYEIVDIKYGEIYLSLYIRRQREMKRWFNILSIIFSAGGIGGYKISSFIPIAACVITGLIQTFNLIGNKFFPSETDIDHICKLREKYIQYLIKLEKLWLDLDTDRMSSNDATDQFFKFKQLRADIESIDNKLFISEIKSLKTKSDTQTREYLNNQYSLN